MWQWPECFALIQPRWKERFQLTFLSNLSHLYSHLANNTRTHWFATFQHKTYYIYEGIWIKTPTIKSIAFYLIFSMTCSRDQMSSNQINFFFLLCGWSFQTCLDFGTSRSFAFSADKNSKFYFFSIDFEIAWKKKHLITGLL